jgi:hypothetical protein
MIRNFTITIVTLLFLGCCGGKSDLQNPDLQSIDLDLATKGKFSDIFDSVKYILLDASEQNPLVDPYNVKIVENRIFVRDWNTNQLFIFDNKGLLEVVIDALGMGPKEYFQMNDFQVKDESVFILDFYLNKIIQFDFSGKFIQESKHQPDNNSIYLGQGYKLLYMGYNPNPQRFNFIRENEKSAEGLVEFEKEKDNIGNLNSHIGFMDDLHGDFVYYNIPYSTKVAVFDRKDGNLYKTLHFDFGKYNAETRILKEEYETQVEVQTQRNLVLYLLAFFPFEKYFLTIFHQGAGHLHFVQLDKDLVVKSQIVDPENDLDQLSIYKIPWSFSENEVVYLSRTSNFYNDYINVFANQKVQLGNGDVHSFFNKYGDKLKEDNWMLIKLRVKNSFPN